MLVNVKERKARELLRKIFANAKVGAEVESVAWIKRETDGEFAAIKIWNPEQMDQYDTILDILTEPNCPLTVTRERTSARYHFIYVAV